MSIELKMPALSPTMEKGTLAKWLVGVGDVVKAGDLIAEIETDKATMELEADQAGKVAEIIISEGTSDVPVGEVLVLLVDAAAESAGTSATSPPASQIVAAPEPASPPRAAAPQDAAPPFPRTRINIAPVAVAIARDDDEIRATPLARRVAAAQGVSLAGVRGSGPRGRIVRADVAPKRDARAAAPLTVVANTPPAPSYGPPDDVPHEVVKLSTMRRTIARRLTESKQTVPHFYLTARCRLDDLLKQRRELNAGLTHRGVKISVNDVLIKALALAMIAVPEVNVQFAGDELYAFNRVDISMAVAIPNGLVTPVIRDVGALSLSAIALQSGALAEKARAGKLAPEDYTGGTASISNLGMFGVDEMFPVLNPPQALILGVGAGIEQPWKVEGRVDLATIMAATASFDHRAIDGAMGAKFMAAFRDLVERPLQILS